MAIAPTIERAYRVRLRPKPAQAHALNRLFGARRWVWNWAIARKQEAWCESGRHLGWIELSREFTALRKAPETCWLQALPREPFEQALRDFGRAWCNFFAGRANRPRRRRYGTVQSARFKIDQRRQAAMVDRHAGVLTLPRLGRVRFRVTEPMIGRLRSVTVSKDPAGRWFASFTADGCPVPAVAKARIEAIGIDMGLKSTAIFSTGETISAGRYLAHKLARLRRYQRHYMRQRDAAARRQGLNPARPFPKGTRITPSNRMCRTRRQIGRLHAGIADARRNHLHQISHRATKLAAVICIEDLAVKGMTRAMGRHAFRRSAAAAALGELRRQVTYKAAWRGRVVSAVGRFYPSSKTCGACGAVNHGLTLHERHWTCATCGAEHDRDVNAAKNIRREGMRLLAGNGTNTPRSGEIDARGVGACAAGSSSPAGQPTTLNREWTYRQAKPGPAATPRMDAT